MRSVIQESNLSCFCSKYYLSNATTQEVKKIPVKDITGIFLVFAILINYCESGIR